MAKISVLSVHKYLVEKNAHLPWLDLTNIRLHTSALDHCTITVRIDGRHTKYHEEHPIVGCRTSNKHYRECNNLSTDRIISKHFTRQYN